MKAAVTYESWRTVWDRYGPAVCAVAVTVAGPANAQQLVSSFIPKAMQLGGDVLDPLEALVAPLITRCSGVEKARVAAVLVRFGVAHERALVVAGARSLGELTDTADVVVPSFDELLALMDPGHESSVVAGGGEVASAGLRRSRLGLIGLIVVGVAVGAGVAAFTARGGGPSAPPLLATLGSPPPPWQLVRAVSRYPVPMGPAETVSQRFRRSAGNIRVAITIVGKAAPFQGNDLGAVDQPAIDLQRRHRGALQRLGGRSVLAFSTGDWAYAEWSERGREVVLSARGMPNDLLRQLISDLQPARAFSTEGFQIPGPGWAKVAVPAQAVSVAPFTELTFRNGNDGSTSTVSAAQSAHKLDEANEPDLFLGDPAPPAPERFTLRAGVTAEKILSGGGVSFWWWDALGKSQVTVSSYSFQGTWPREVEVMQLAASIRFVDRAGWDTMMAFMQTDIRQGRVLQTVVLGPLELSYRLYNGLNRAASTVCTPTVCTLWDDSALSGSSADLLIDGNWWHLERTGILANAPTWRTSPAMARIPQFQSAAYGRQIWRALDLGTRTKALRRNDDATAFGRPAA